MEIKLKKSGYKVVDKVGRKLLPYSHEGKSSGIVYKVKKWIDRMSIPSNGPICIFNTMSDVENYLKYCGIKKKQALIYECDYEENTSDCKSLWTKEFSCPTASLPDGTVLCEKVKLIKTL